MAQTKSKNSPPGKSNGMTSSSQNANGNSAKDNSAKLETLFIDSLKDIYWAEKHLVKTLPKMIKAATSGELKKSFNEHLDVTKVQVGRLEQSFELMGVKAQAKKCDAMEGLTKEGEGIIEDTDEGSLTRDVGLIMAAQKVEHYEIATYGSLAQLAKTLGKNDVAELMDQTLEEEKEADQLLSNIAMNCINEEATVE